MCSCEQVIGFGYGEQKLHKTLMDVLRGNKAMLLEQRAEAMPRDDPRAEALLCGGHCIFANRFPLTISQQLRLTSGEFTTALARKLGLVNPQLLTAVGMPLSNNTNSAREVGPMAITPGNCVAQFWLAYLMISTPRVFPYKAAWEYMQKTHYHNVLSRTSYLTMTNGTSRASSLTCCSTAHFLRASRLSLLTAISISAN